MASEKKLLFFAIITMALGIFAIGLNHLFRPQGDGVSHGKIQSELGTIYPDGQDIKRKGFKTFEFSKVDTIKTLYQKDTIYVGPGSRALLDLKEYGQLKLSPNAVVLITLDFEDQPTQNLLPQDSSPVSSHLTTKRKTLRLKLEEGQAEFIKAPRAPTTATYIATDRIVLEIGDRVEVDLSNQKTFKAENTKDKIAHVIEAENPETIQAIVKHEDGNQEKIKLGVNDALQVTEKSIKKLATPVSSISETTTEALSAPPVRKPATVGAMLPPSLPAVDQTSDKSTTDSSKTFGATSDELSLKTQLRSSLDLRLSLASSRLEATDLNGRKKAVLYAPVIIGAELGTTIAVTNNYSLFANTGVQFATINEPQGVSLSHTSPSLLNFELGAIGKISNNVQFFISGGFSQKLSLSPYSTNEISVDRVGIPEASLGTDFAFYKNIDSTAGIRASADLLLPGKAKNYSSTVGTETNLSFYFLKHAQTLTYQFGVGVQSSEIKTSFSEVKQASLILHFGIQANL